jgi:hypothetical protein
VDLALWEGVTLWASLNQDLLKAAPGAELLGRGGPPGMILMVPIPDRTLGKVLLGLRPGGLGCGGLRGFGALGSPLRGLLRLLGRRPLGPLLRALGSLLLRALGSLERLLKGDAGIGHPGASWKEWA